MESPINPFFYDRPVLDAQYFIGREAIINRCYDYLTGPTPNSIAISGEYGLGKTSLLHHLTLLAKEENWERQYTVPLFIYLDCSTIKKFRLADFWHKVLDLVKLKEEASVLHQEIDKLLAQPNIEARDIKRILRWLAGQQLYLVLALDEFDSIVKRNISNRTMVYDFFASLRYLANTPDYALTLLTATRKPLNTLCSDLVKEQPRAYFYSNFFFESLTPFNSNEISNLFERVSRVNVEFDQADFELLGRLAGAHPTLLQLAGYHLFENRREAPLTDKAQVEVMKSFAKDAEKCFAHLWTGVSPLEQLLCCLIIFPHLPRQAAPQLELLNEDIDSLFQRYEYDLERLIARGLVQKIEDTYQIFSPIFAKWIVDNIAHESRATLAEQYLAIDEELLHHIWQRLRKQASYLTMDKLTQILIERPSGLVPPIPLPERYYLEKVLGMGGRGVVYKAKDIFEGVELGQVAIKILNSLSDDPKHLLIEARAVSSLNHPHIVKLHFVGKAHDQIYLVMEYLEGETLRSRLGKGRLSLPETISWIRQAADALDYAHQKGFIHRDIKPANLILTATGLKLTDFDIAKNINDKASSGIKGTPPYMSPEQIDAEELSGCSDLFSLAVVAFEMLSGASPWSDTSDYKVMTSITQDPPRSLADFEIPNAIELDLIFQKALAKNPDERYQSGVDFVQALGNAAGLEQTSLLTDGNREIIERLDRLEDKIDQADADRLAGELRDWAQKVQQVVSSVDSETQAKLSTLTKHTGGTYQYLQLAIPIIPGLLKYNVELGGQNQLDLKAIWEHLKKRLSKRT